MRQISVIRFIALIVCFALYPLQASAQLGQNMLIGNAKAISLGHAVTADPPGIDSIHFNPAGLTKLKGRQYHAKFITGTFEVTGEFETTPEYDEVLRFIDEEDDVIGTKSSTNTAAVVLPGVGWLDLPILAFPLGGVSYNKEGSKWTFANNIYAPLIVGLKRDDDDPARYQGKHIGITRLTYFAPSFGYEVTPTLSVGASLGFNYMGFGLDFDMRTPNILLGAVTQIQDITCHDGDDVSWLIDVCGGKFSPTQAIATVDIIMDTALSLAWNVGFLWDVTPWITWGAVYQSSSKDHLEGVADIQLTPDTQGFINTLNTSDPTALALLQLFNLPENGDMHPIDASLDLEYPAHFATGVSVKVLPKLKVNVDAKWTDNGVWDQWQVDFHEDIPIFDLIAILEPRYIAADKLVIPRDYVSTWSWALGIEYQYSSVLALRFGYEPRPSAIPDDKRDLFIPITDTTVVSVGFSYDMKEKGLFDMALAQIHSKNFIPAGSSTNINNGSFSNLVYNPYAGLDVKSELTVTVIEMSYSKNY